MIAYLKRQGLYEVSIGFGKESYEYEKHWLNYGDRAFGRIGLVVSPRLRYLIDSAEYQKHIWTKLDRTFGNRNEYYNRNLEIKPNSIRFIFSKVSASILYDEVVQDEEESESSTQSIRIEESLLEVTPPDAPKVYEIYDISSSHMDDTEE